MNDRQIRDRDAVQKHHHQHGRYTASTRNSIYSHVQQVAKDLSAGRPVVARPAPVFPVLSVADHRPSNIQPSRLFQACMSFLNENCIQKSTILITGGATGIGLALAHRLLSLGHEIIVAGRRQSVLDEAVKAHPGLKAVVGDVSSDESRIALFNNVVKQYPSVNVLINNAGILNMEVNSMKCSTAEDWVSHKKVLDTNIDGTVHLSLLFVPHLLTKDQAAVVNVTSILAYFPYANLMSYCASKAAVHSFTQSLRQQLKGTAVAVIEIAPPAVNTGILPDHGMDLDIYADHTIKQLLQGTDEIGYESEHILHGSRQQLDHEFNVWNGNTVKNGGDAAEAGRN